MAKTAIVFECTHCGAQTPQWHGRCSDCGTWGSLEQTQVGPVESEQHVGITGEGVVPLAEVSLLDAVPTPTGMSELDRVLSGGLVPGSVTVLGGEPGIGKSTMTLQMLGSLAALGHRCLLVCGEESPKQVKLRADRLGVNTAGISVLGATSLAHALDQISAFSPDVVVVDSIQTMAHPDCAGVPGSVAQVAGCAQRLTALAKNSGPAVVMVGHVTKEGSLAGPRVLEHVVDTVLAFEGDRTQSVRLLRAHKHRFGSTHEVGIFSMGTAGLLPLCQPSGSTERGEQPRPGSVIGAVTMGARPVLIEVQALVTPSPAARRMSQGIDAGRLNMIIAILEQHGGVDFAACDVYASVVGGIRVSAPDADLALALALASARRGRSVWAGLAACGELDLVGDVRPTSGSERALAEAQRLGYTKLLGSKSGVGVEDSPVIQIATLRDALRSAGLVGPLAASVS
ncbi:MAG: DNA repair protein RadA [Actinobacteria bacterium]|nr:DNA repair protein RadA [Actinomycetota bacterium]MCB9389742.1 DNA repair protein RadA [Acidimicrobiia bacterium]